MNNVIKFPLAHVEKRIEDNFNETFARMQAAGMTQEEMQALLRKTLADMGAVEVDGVWTIPGASHGR